MPSVLMGPGTIACPLRGELAVQRCLQYQAERACTCDVYRAHPSAAPVVPAEQLCGRQLDGGLRQQLLVNAAAPKSGDGEEDTMATNSRTRGHCASCGNTAPKGTRLVDGRCSDCRALKADDGNARVTMPLPYNARAKSEERRAAPTPSPGVLARVPRQQTLPTVADQRITELELALADKDRELAHTRWKMRRILLLVEGLGQGWANLQELATAAHADLLAIARDGTSS